MVKKLLLINFTVLFFCAVMVFSGCTNDFFGLFGSTDLNERLAERNNFKFLNKEEDRILNLGNDYSFIVVSDTHIEDGNAHGLEKLKNVIDSNSKIEFVVFNGDITQYGTAQDLQVFMDIADSLSVPCFPVIGNHDIYFGNWQNWKDMIGSTNYRIDSGGTTLLIMDSANTYLGNDQINWLERELKSVSGRVFVFSHANLFVNNLAEVHQFADTKERARIISILRNKCDIMFMGHSHFRSINETGNVIYINIEDFKSNKTYCIVTVSSDGISYKFDKL